MVRERMITEREALQRIEPNNMDFYLHPMIAPAYADSSDPRVAPSVLGKGTSVSEGAVVGHLVFTMEQLQDGVRDGKACILVATEHLYAPIAGLKAIVGLLLLRGERTSFAASAMRKMGKVGWGLGNGGWRRKTVLPLFLYSFLCFILCRCCN
mmetsp:Transcript_3548/g.8060  ORF Transcript_3548/g.8060 Transcript_3548/m.8060 type:complete len:153 (-) Transcript_3548:30-488(-)